MKRRIRKLLTLLLILTILTQMLPWSITVQALDATGNWIEYVGNSDLTYSADTLEYDIDSAEDLAWIAYQVNNDVTSFSGCTLNITDNIDLSEHLWTSIGIWTPSGSNMHSFSGTFNGNSHTISGLTLDSDTIYSVGLFGYISGATIEKVNLEELSITNETTPYYVGGIVGNAVSASTIDSCYVSGNISAQAYDVGGICGRYYGNSNTGGKITNCSASCVVDGYDFVGGIAGYASYMTIMNCASSGHISGDLVTGGPGGVVGCAESVTVQNCFSSCDILGNSKYAGGFAAYTYSCTYTNNYSIGSVQGNESTERVGGFFGGQWSNTISNCYWETADGIFSSGTNFSTTNVTVESEADMKSNDFAVLLNTNALAITGAASWVIVSGENSGYPKLSGVGVYGALSAPFAFNAEVGGHTTVGYTLSAKYDYCDLHNAAESGSTYQWYRATDSSGSNATEIDGQTQQTYVVTVDDLGKYFYVEIRPSNGTYAGDTVVSDISGEIKSCEFAGGLGTDDDPYIITTLTQLEAVTDYPDACFELGNNITDALTAPICSNTSQFTGSFDGKGYSITIDMSISDISYVGAFGYIGSSGQVSNLTVTGSVTSSYDTGYVGGLTGYNAGTVENCISSVTVTANGTTAYYAGGLVGYNTGTITGCSATGDVSGGSTESFCIGGLVGQNFNVNTSSGTLTSTAVITDCYATGTVTSVTATNKGYVGGLLGANYSASTTSLTTPAYGITNCFATGNVSAAGGYIGGFTGYNRITSTTNCFASGDVIVSGTVNVGGFTGFNRAGAILDHCYSTGDVSASSVSSSSYYGGLIGYLYSGTAQYSYAAGEVSAESTYVGGVTGNYRSGTITGCYWNAGKNTIAAGNKSSSTSADTTYGTGLTVSKMAGATAATNMSALDFTTPYYGTKATDDSYGYLPQLKTFAESGDSVIAAASLESVILPLNYSVTPTSKTFSSVTEDYEEQTAQQFAIKNIGTSTISGLQTTLTTGTAFEISTDLSAASLESGNTATVSVRPRTGLSVGNYSDTLTIVGDNEVPLTVILSFRVNASSNTAPTLKSGVDATVTASVTVNTEYTLDLSSIFEDTDGDDLTYKVSVNNGDYVTADTSYSYTPTTTGTDKLVFKANDSTVDSTDTFTVTMSVNEAPTYGIGLSQTTAYTFTAQTVGYSSVSPLSVTVNNMGNQATGDLTVALSGTNATSFTLSGTTIGSINLSGSDSFTVKPNDSLTAGTYTATVTVSGSDVTSQSFTISFTVNPAPTYGIGLNQTGPYTFTAQTVGYSSVSPLSVTVNNTGNQATGDLAVALTGTSKDSFMLSGTTIGSINLSGSDTFTVKPNDSLTAGTYTATVTVSGSDVTSQSFTISFTVNPAPTYGIGLSQTGPYTFTAQTVGYSSVSSLDVTVSNTGNQATGALTVALSGTGKDSFMLSGTTIGSINLSGSDSFTVKPNDSLTAGTYTATVTVSGSDVTSQSFTISFTVNPAPTYGIGLSQTGPYTFTAQTVGYSSVSPLSVTVNNTGNQATGDLAVALTGTGKDSFMLSGTTIGSINLSGSDTFTVKPNDSLTAGTYTATVTVSGSDVTSQSFTISFTVNPAPTYGIGLNQTGPYTFTAQTVGYSSVSPLSVTVNNTGNQATGDLAVALTGTGKDSFMLSGTTIGSINLSGSDTFTVKPNDSLTAGTYTATVTVSGSDVDSQSFAVSFTVNPVPTYSIGLSQTGPYTFTAQTVGYSSVSPLSVTVNNTGNQATGDLAVALTGTGKDSFMLSGTTIGSINLSGSDTFTVKPNDGLTAGTYTATVTVSGSDVTSQSFTISFTVNPAPTYGIGLSQTGPYTFTAQTVGYSSVSPLSVTVNNTGNQATGDLAVALTGTGKDSFMLSGTTIGSINLSGSDTFTVKPNDSLTAGTYTATVTVSGSDVTSQSFAVSFTVNSAPTYGIGLSQTGPYTFTAQTVGYSSVSPLSVTVNNTGNQATGDLAVALTGTGKDSFMLSGTTIGSINLSGSDSFTVKPNDSLTAGTYTATVTISGSDVTSQSFTVSFTVNPVSTYSISLSQTGPYTFTAQTVGYSSVSPLDVTVSNTGNQATGDLAVALTGTGKDSFMLSGTTIGSINLSGSDSFTVKPNDSLTAGTYTATVTISGSDVTSQSFTVSFTVNPKSSAKAITGFILSGVDGTIIEADHTIAVTLPYGTSVTSLTPTITVSDKATVTPASGAAQDFTSPVDYTVTAENESTQIYTVTVTVAKNSDKTLVSVTAPSAITGLTNGTAKTVSALGLPSTVMLITDNGNVQADISWDLASCSYDASSSSAQLFKVSGTVTLPDGVVNTNSVSLTTSVSVTVKAASSSGGGSSSRGSGNASTNNSSITVTTNAGTTTAAETFTAKTDSDGMATASVTKDQIADMIKAVSENAQEQNTQKALEIKVDPDSTAAGVSVTIPQRAASSLKDGINSLTIVSPAVAVTFDEKALAEIGKNTNGDITLKAVKLKDTALSDEHKAVIGTRPVYDLKVASGSTTVSTFGGGTATVSVPYTLVAGENVNAIVVYYINASGELITVPNCVYDAKTGTVTFTTTHFSTYAVGYNNVSFSDITGSAWYANYVTYLAARGIVGGNNGAYNPNESITRAEFVTILARMSGESLSGYMTSTFSDVATDRWYFAVAQWANNAEIVSGYDGKFNPSATITREQMAAMLYRYAEYKGTVSNTEGMSVREFSDYDSISSWAQAPVQWAMNNGILSGNTDGSFAPQSSATRAQTTKMLAVLLQSM